MPITTGGFEDLVQLKQDTLNYVGPDLEIGNTSVGSTASIGFNNTAGDLQLVGIATGNATCSLPAAGGVLLTGINLSAGTTSNNLSAAVFSNTYNVSFGLSGSTVTASANLTNDWFDNLAGWDPSLSGSSGFGSMSNFTASASTFFVAPLHGYGLMPFDITAGTCFFPDMSISGSTATMSAAFTSQWMLGVYTLSGSSLSLLNSASYTFGFAAAATNNSTGFAGGNRYGTFGTTAWSSNPVFKQGSRYWLAWMWSSSGALNQTGVMNGNWFFGTGQRSGFIGASSLTGTTNGAAPFCGVYSAALVAPPAVIGSSQLVKTASIAGFSPHIMFANNASLTIF